MGSSPFSFLLALPSFFFISQFSLYIFPTFLELHGFCFFFFDRTWQMDIIIIITVIIGNDSPPKKASRTPTVSLFWSYCPFFMTTFGLAWWKSSHPKQVPSSPSHTNVPVSYSQHIHVHVQICLHSLPNNMFPCSINPLGKHIWGLISGKDTVLYR